MSRFKLTYAGVLKYRAEPECPISQYELDTLRATPFKDLIEIQNTKDKELSYKITGSVTLAQEMQKGIQEKRLHEIVVQVLKLKETLKTVGLCFERVLLAPDYIYEGFLGEPLKFLYLPVNGESLVYDLALFLQDLVHAAELSGDARLKWKGWCKKFTQYPEFVGDIPSLEESGGKKPAPEPIDNILDDDAETGLDSSEMADYSDWNAKPDDIQPYVDDDGEAPTGMNPEDVFGVDDGFDDAPTGIEEKQKFDMMDKKDGTFMESASECAVHTVTARLISTEDDTVVTIDQDAFLIGRNRKLVDFAIQDNRISGKHAEILRRSGRFYLRDCNSTNGTYLDENKLVKYQEVPLSSGSIIRFYNKEYRFKIS